MFERKNAKLNTDTSYNVCIYERFVEPLLVSLKTQTAGLCHSLGGGVILDIGCGPAALAGMLCTDKKNHKESFCVTPDMPSSMAFVPANQPVRYVGLDTDLDMLAAARKRLANYKCAPFFHAKLVHAEATALPFADKSIDISILSLVLHQLDERARVLALYEAMRVSKRVLVADYKMPERNLDYMGYALGNGVERLVGGDHYDHYRTYMAQGGIEGLLQRFCVAQRTPALLGAVTVAVVDARERS